jgi:hypothetical protein
MPVRRFLPVRHVHARARLAKLAIGITLFFEHDETTLQFVVTGYGTTLQPLKGRTNRTALVLPTWWDFHDENASGVVRGGEHDPHCASLALLVVRADHRGGGAQARTAERPHLPPHVRAALSRDGRSARGVATLLGHASIRTTEESYGWLAEQSATTLARARIYGEGLRVVSGAKSGEKGTIYGTKSRNSLCCNVNLPSARRWRGSSYAPDSPSCPGRSSGPPDLPQSPPRRTPSR